MSTHNNTMKGTASKTSEPTFPSQQSTNGAVDDRLTSKDPSSTGDDKSNDMPNDFLTIEGLKILLDKNGKILATNTRGAYGPLDASKRTQPIQVINDTVEGIDHTFSTKFINNRGYKNDKSWYGAKEKEDEKVLHDLIQDHTNRCISHIQYPASNSGLDISSQAQNRPKVTLVKKYDVSLHNNPKRKSDSSWNPNVDSSTVQDRLTRSAVYPLEHRKFDWHAENEDLEVKKYKDTKVGYEINLHWDSITERVWPEYLSMLGNDPTLLKPIGPEPGSTFMGHIVTNADLPELKDVELWCYQ